MNFTTDIETFFTKIKSKYNQVQQWAFLTVLLVGILAHGFIIFNRISYHDNTTCLFSLGATYELGRWGLGIIYDLQLLTTKTFAVPVFNGIISLIFIAFSAMKIVDIFDIKSKAGAVAIGAIMVVFPVVPSIFSFMFTSWPYFFGLYLAVCAGQVLAKKPSVKNFIFSVMLLACSLGMYQAFFAVTITIFLIKLLQDVITGEIDSIAAYAKRGFTYLASLGASLVVWSVLAKVLKMVRGINTMEYKGMGEAYDISQLPTRIILSVKDFFQASYAHVNELRFLRVLTLCIILATILHIIVLVLKNGKNVPVKVAALIGAALLPVGMNVMYILSTSADFYVDSLMVYGDTFVLILPVIIIEGLSKTEFKQGIPTTLLKVVTWLQIIAITVITVGYIYLDNAAYMKADLAQQQTTSYYNQLIANIKSCEGFKDDMEIVFVNMDENQDGTFVSVDDNDQLKAIKIDKYPIYQDLVRYGSAIEYMQEHCGFGNELVSRDDGTLAQDPQIQAMPNYPDDGSIAVVDGKVIVKFGQ